MKTFQNQNFLKSNKNRLLSAGGIIGMGGIALALALGGGKDVVPTKSTITPTPTHEAAAPLPVLPSQEAQAVYSQFNPVVYEQAGSRLTQEIVDNVSMLAEAGATQIQPTKESTIVYGNGPADLPVATQESAIGSVGFDTTPTPAIVAGGPTAPMGVEAKPGDPYNPDLSKDTQTDQQSTEIAPADTVPSIGPEGNVDNVNSANQSDSTMIVPSNGPPTYTPDN